MKLLVFLFCFWGYAQQIADPKAHWSIKDGDVYQGSKEFSNKEIRQLLLNEPISMAHFKAKNRNQFVGETLMMSGSFCLGYAAGCWITAKPGGWQSLGFGLGFIGLAIPFELKASKHAKNLVERLNNKSTTTTFRLQVSPNGVGVCWGF
jgi:hypothetical protein